MIDAVLSYHMNGDTCGVARFNKQLAQRLGVPCLPHTTVAPAAHPLVSIKPAEMPYPADRYWERYDLLLHDRTLSPNSVIMEGASRVVYADEMGCPSTLRGDPTRMGLTILSYGMAHKLQQPLFEKLKSLLDAHGQSYTVCVSSAIHEGSPWDQTTAEHTARLRDIFGDHLRWLGFLADDALAREIREAHTIALFYDPAVRANNTTLWAALDAGTPVVTNLDAQSPPELVHGVSVLDIHQLTEWPDYNGERQILRAGGHVASAAYSWDKLIEKLTAEVPA